MPKARPGIRHPTFKDRTTPIGRARSIVAEKGHEVVQ
jgi:hypothetical protein